MNKWITLVCLIVILIPLDVQAESESVETVNDFFKLYNEAQLEDLSELEAEYLSAMESYDLALKDVELKEVHNSVVDLAKDWKEGKIQELSEEIDTILDENSIIAKEIKNYISADWDNLSKLDAKYKMNLKKIDDLLLRKNTYSTTDYRNIDYIALDELGKEIESLKENYVSAVEVEALGEVTGVKYPLGAETVVTSPFGDRIDPITKSRVSFHSGIDLRASVGTEVLSLFNGVVSDTGYGALGGYYVRIDHSNGITSYYCHLSEINCKKGQTVEQYDCIALSGNTGSRTTGPHLHLGLYINGIPVDPAILFEGE